MKLSIFVLAATWLVHTTPLHGQQTPRSDTGSTSDGVFRQLRLREPDYADPATRRLEILTEIWGNVGLYHPVPSAMHLKWDDVLVEALRSMPQVHSDRDLVDLLNRVVFAPLNDPLVYAAIRSTDSPSAAIPSVEGRWLDSSTAYVRAADDLGTAPFATRVRAIIDSLARSRTPARLVIDLRSPVQGAYFLSAPWLGMWTREPIARASDLSLLRATDDPLGDAKWLVTPWDSLRPISPAIATPTVFIVNRTTYPAVERSIDALRAHRTDVAVVFEATGEIPIMWDQEHFPQAWYPDSILLPSTRQPFISADGTLGSVVDIASPTAIPMADVATVAARALAARASQPLRKRFVFTHASIRDDTVSLGPLTREQRLAGALKAWFWVLHFYAYPDDISGDWRHALKWVVPQVDAVRSDSAYYRILHRMIGSLNDTHAGVEHPLADGPRSPSRAYSVPLTFGWVEHRLVVTRADTTAAVGIARGDEVLALDGRSVREVAAEARPYWSLSPPDANTPVFFLMGPRNSTMRLRVRSASGVHEVTLPRSHPFMFRNPTPISPHRAYEVLPGNIGFIDLGQMTSQDLLDSAMTALANTRGMVLDERNGPVAYGAQHIVYRFIKGPIPCMRRVESISYLGYSVFPTQALGATQCWTVPPVSRSVPTYTRPLVVMTSRADISYAESLAQKLRIAHRALLVGEPTNGTFGWKDGITLPGGAVVYFTRGRALWPNGAKYHRVGVLPDVPAHATLSGLRHGRDEVYETALATLKHHLKE